MRTQALDFQAFRDHPFIRTIADKERWTVSDKDKMPIDMYTLKFRGQISGAVYHNEQSLMTLDDVHDLIPQAANYAFYLDALDEDICVLDIEPTCPATLRDRFLTLDYLYGERSMSGKGIHLVFPLPIDILNEFKAASQKVVMKEKTGYYEILLAHFVTFTGDQIAPSGQKDPDGFRNLFRTMASMQKETQRNDVKISLTDMTAPNTPFIRTHLKENMEKWLKTHSLETYSGDDSRFEYAFMNYAQLRLGNILQVAKVKKTGYEYSMDEIAWYMADAAEALLPPRPKHEEERAGLPWLLYLAQEALAKAYPVKEPTKSQLEERYYPVIRNGTNTIVFTKKRYSEQEIRATQATYPKITIGFIECTILENERSQAKSLLIDNVRDPWDVKLSEPKTP